MTAVLVTGATGTVGRHLVRQLIDAGHEVRALTRNPANATAALPPEAKVFTGDLAAPAGLAEALDGVTAVHLTPFEGNASELVDAIVRAGARRVTVMWAGFSGAMEEAVRSSGMDWTFIQPMEFMSNMAEWAESVRLEGVAREVYPQVRNASVHPADIAAVTARALTEDGHAGKAYDLTGPEALTVPEKVAVLSAALGKQIRFVELPEAEARDRMRAKGVAEEDIDFVLGWHANPPKEAYTVTPVIEEVTGRPARTFAQWAAENADAFR
ncbi:NAD(P)H-binding protein [Allokutzneria sp. NRRL B-24872]|uniref:NAD(P)H-binding protein n=1 Tax=Allokutzneria sp. NRRL B-24872 TaxID=1137961 RepID=UPI000A399837|nr:NAD(P)H-binding protein [Allokutzneria sp. NRRL B-24872]